jgi:hypothetical protein
MIIRGFQKGDAASRAWYSPCGVYRYRLERVWAPGALLACVMLNPSTATEERNDPTIERCERRARALGFGGLSVVNLFAFRATYPADLRRAADPVGPGNVAALQEVALAAGLVLCGWGTHGDLLGQGRLVAENMRGQGVALHHLGLTKGGQPRHPLYVGYGVAPQLWL